MKDTTSIVLGQRQIRPLAASLVDWYRREQRELPWRHSSDPYAIWVSEIMLQQTRVAAVLPRYDDFLRRFPDVERLAAAPLSELLAAWAGLGYYRRARQLHACAQHIVEQQGSRFPETAAALRLLPGFGAYTAGAVASIAFGEAVAAVDGNVERVLARLLALDDDPKRGDAAKTVRGLASQLVQCAPPAELNQALMELGALVCTSKAPRCGDCPWRGDCAAAATGVADSFPRRPPRRASVAVSCYGAIVRRGSEFLLRRRPEGGHNAQLWELPTTPWHGGATEPARALAALGELAAESGLRWEIGEALVSVRHSITHHRIHLVAYEVEAETGADGGEDWRWADADAAVELGLTAASRKVLALLPPLL